MPPTAAPARRGPLVWILGCLGAGLMCSCLGFGGLLGLGLLSRPGTATVGGPVAVAPAANANETPGTRTTITTGDLVGSWHSGGGTVAVDSRTGGYSENGSVATADRFDLNADMTYHEVANGMLNGSTYHEEKTGTWALEPDKVVFHPNGGPDEGYWFRSYEIRADGGRTITLLSDRNPNDHGYDLYADRWSRDP